MRINVSDAAGERKLPSLLIARCPPMPRFPMLYQVTAPYIVTSIISENLIDVMNAGISRQISAVTSHFFSSWEI
jgi:hypothetical protein